MDLYFLPENIKNAVAKLDYDKLYELRLRRNAPVKVWYNFKKYYLGADFITLDPKNALVCTNENIESIIYTVTEYSLYAANERIKDGFVTTHGGVRLGIGGECVTENGKVVTIKNFSSLCIRFPHEIVGAADKLCEAAFVGGIKNLLIISPPGFGKTTLLKDILRRYSDAFNTLVIDERGELSDCPNADFIRFSDKNYAFDYGVRTLAPEIVITDELGSETDWRCVEKASASGVKIIATAHGGSLADITAKSGFKMGVFERYAVLSSEGAAGRLKKLYDGNLNELT